MNTSSLSKRPSVGLLAVVVALTFAFGLSEAHGQIFVTNASGNTVGEYNLDGTVVNASLISGLSMPVGIVVQGPNLFVSNNNSGTIGEYTTGGVAVNASLISGLTRGFPGIALSGSNIFVSNFAQNTITNTIGEYTTSGVTVNASLVTGLAGPQGVAVAGSYLYVANGNNVAPNLIDTVGKYTTDGATINASLVSEAGVNNGFGLVGIAISGSNLFVTNADNGSVGEFDSVTGATINASLISGLNQPVGVAVSGSHLFVTNFGSGTVGEYNLDGTVVNASLISGLSGPVGIAIASVSGGPAVSFYGAGPLPGSPAPVSEIRDAVMTTSGLVAVGAVQARSFSGFEDTAMRWTPAGGITLLPDVVTNTNGASFITASAITPAGSLILGRSRSAATGNARAATTWSGDGTSPTSLGTLAPGASISAVNGTSDDGTVLYGFGADAAGNWEPFRWTAAAGMVGLGVLNSGDVMNIPAALAVSSDGSVMAGTSGTDAGPDGGNRAYRYVQGSGMAALPLPAGGTWSCALALTPDGNLTLGAADTPANPNGELVLWNQSASTVTPLGAPITNGHPSNFGGITSDGQVAAISFFDPNDLASLGDSYIHNSHGWFSLQRILAVAGANLDGWQLNTVLGISPDGTLAWGSGLHNGVQQGWVASFPSGFLAGVTTAAEVDLLFIGKSHERVQTDATTLIEMPGQPWQFHASLQGKGFTVNDPTPPSRVTPPASSTSGAVDLSPTGPNEWKFSSEVGASPGFSTHANLDSAFADGTYAFAAGGTTVSLSLAGELYPDAPRATVSAGRWSVGKLVIDPSQPLTITTAFGSTNYAAGQSYLAINVEGTGFKVDNRVDLTASSLSLTIPAGTLAAGQTYHVHLEAMRGSTVDGTLYPGALAVAGYESATGFDLVVPGSAPQPQLAAATYLSNGSLRRGLAVVATPSNVYVSGTTSENDTDGLVAGYATGFVDNAIPAWTSMWPGAAGSDEFAGIAVAGDGVYVVGDSYSRTTDAAGGKENKGITVKFPLTGPTATGTGETWAFQTPAAPGAFTYGGGEALIAVATANENSSTFVYATGSGQQNFSNGGRLFLSKLDAAGNIIWTRDDSGSMVNNAYSRGQGVCVLNGNIYVAGRDDDSGSGHAYMRKYDSGGNLVWSHTSASYEYNAVTAIGDAIVAVGSTAPNNLTNSDFLVDKWDESGNVTWSRTFDNGGDDRLYGIVAFNGRLFAVGSTTGSTAGGIDAVLTEIDPGTGDLLSTIPFGGSGDDTARAVATDGKDLYVVGETSSFGGAGTNAMLLRYSFPAGSIPSITGFAPSTAAAGAAVTITGSGFTSATNVAFNGQPAASFTVDSDAQITAVVPLFAGSGPVSVSSPGGATVSTSSLTITPTSVGFFEAGSLPGNASPMSEFRDAVMTANGIVAVGSVQARPFSGNEDTAMRWTLAGGMTLLPDVVTNTDGLSFITASAITPSGSLILGRSRSVASGNARAATTWSGDGTSPTSLGTLAPGASISAVNGTSDDGTVLYGFGADAAGNWEPFRWTAAGGMVGLGVLNSGDVMNIPAALAVSSDGSVMAGTSGTDGIPGPGNRAYRYVQGSGMTALPLPAGATWSGALALTPDGNLTLGVVNSVGAPNGEFVLWNQSAAITTELGTPDPTLTPNILGGLTADGQVAVVSCFDPQGNRPGGAFVRNSHGWFDLQRILADAGVNLGDWIINGVEGVSPNGGLVWGSGMHHGIQQGWVASLPPGYLAAVTSAADINFVFVGKVRENRQTDAATVAPATLPWQFHASLQGHNFTSTEPTLPNRVAPPAGSASGPVNLGFVSSEEWQWQSDDTATHGFATQADLDAAFTNGNYLFLAGGSSVSLSLTGDLYPDAPQATVTGGAWSSGAYVIDANQPLTVAGSFGATNYAAGQSYIAVKIEGTDFSADNGADLTATSVSLNVPPRALSPGRTYKVAVDAIRGSTLTNSSPGFPNTKAVAGYENITELDLQVTGIQFDQQPQDVTATAGTSVSFSASVIATGTVAYQWNKDGTDIAGATNSSLDFGSVQPSDAGTYSLVVNNGTVSATSNTAVLVVNPTGAIPYINGSVRSQTALVGANVTFSVPVGGTEPFSYQWRRSGMDISGATGPTLTLSGVQFGDAGSYSVHIANSAGAFDSPPMKLTVASAPPANDDFANAGVVSGSEVHAGGSNVGASSEAGEPQLNGGLAATSQGSSVWWKWTAPSNGVYSLDTVGSNFETQLAVFTGSAVTSLQIVGANDHGAGNAGALTFSAASGTTYYFMVQGYLGDSGSIQLNLATGTASAPAMVKVPQNDSIPLGGSVTLEVGVAGTFPFTFQWYKGIAAISGATASALALNNVQSADAGDYTVVVTNGVSSVTSSAATLTVAPLRPIQSDELLVSDHNLSPSGLGGIVRVNKQTGAQVIISLGGSFGDLFQVAYESPTSAIAVDAGGSATGGRAFRVDLTSGRQTLLATGLGHAVGVTLDPAGNIYVTDDGFGGIGSVYKVTPGGQVSRLATGGEPGAIVYHPDGFIYFIGATAGSGGQPGIARLDPSTGQWSSLSALGYPYGGGLGLAVDTNGDLLVADGGGTSATTDNRIFRVDRATGAQTLLSSATNAHNPRAISVDGNGTIFVGDCGDNSTDGIAGVFTLNRSSGVLTPLSIGTHFRNLVGIAGARNVAYKLQTPFDPSTQDTVVATGSGGHRAEPKSQSAAAFLGRLFYAIYGDGTPTPSKIYRFDPATGQNTVVLSDATDQFWSLKVMQGALWISHIDGSLWSSPDGETFGLVGSSPFGSNNYVTAMEEFNGHMYFATSAGGIYQSVDGTSFTKVETITAGKPIFALAAWKGYIYAADTEDYSYASQLLRSQDGANWAALGTFHTYEFCNFVAASDYLYVSSVEDASGLSFAVRGTTDGVNWTQLFYTTTEGKADQGVASYFDQTGRSYFISADFSEWRLFPIAGGTMDSRVVLSHAYASIVDVSGELFGIGGPAFGDDSHFIVGILGNYVPSFVQGPSIAGFSPTTGGAGATITITGTGFTGTTAVRVNGLVATSFTVNSDTQISAVVPPFATTGPISVSTAGGTATSESSLAVVAAPRALVNLSVRAMVGAGDGGALVSSFTIEGATPKTVLIRGVGPTLANLGLSGTLADPLLSVFDSTGALIAQNDNWGSVATSPAIDATRQAVGAFPLADDSKDAALLLTLNPGTYTARVAGVGGSTGMALLEVYDADASPRIVYIDVRANVGGGPTIAGFVISGSSPQTVLIRALGPALDVAGALPNPTLTVYDSGQTAVASNDDWGSATDPSAITNASASAGLMPLASGSADSALLLTLAPGLYTAAVSGVNGGSGIAMLEIAQIDSNRATAAVPAILGAIPSQMVGAGGNANFRVPAYVGIPNAITFQWQKNGAPVSGATNAALALTNVQAADAGAYSVMLTNAAGSTTSAAADLSVNFAPQIGTQPQSQTVTAGTSVSFSVTATGSPAPTYQWRRNGLNITGATTPTLTLPGVQPADAGSYTVVVANGAGSIMSSAATLTVNAPAVAPTIATAPVAQTVTSGANVTFTVAAGGSPSPTYQWSKDGAVITGATDATLTLNNVQTGDSGSYAVSVSNSAGSLTATATLTVNAPGTGPSASLSVLGSPVYASTGGTLTLAGSIDYTGLAPAALDFTINLPPGWAYVGTSGLNVPNVAPAGGTTGALGFAYSSFPADQVAFTVLVSYPAGLTGNQTFTSSADFRSPLQPLTIPNVVLTRVDPPTIVTQPVSTAAVVGSSVTFTVSASSSASLSYQWQKNGADIAGATASTLTLANVQLADAGSYGVVVGNAAGTTASAVATLVVIDAHATHAVSGAGYAPGGTVTITNTLTYGGTSSSIGWQVLLPAGWSYASGGGSEGDVRPAVGATDLLEWAWTTIPPSPITFTYTLNVPASTTGDQQLSGLVLFRQNGSLVQFLAVPDPLVVSQATWHSADENHDGSIGLLELTRVIELYNTRNGTVRTGAYSVQDGTEDGFTTDAVRSGTDVVTLTRYHSADENHDGKIDLLELTRVIELYNYRVGTVRTGQYHVQAGTEDGYAPGP